MAAKRMYFGTRERMTWVKCPTVDTPLSKVGWQGKVQFLNGGAVVRRSSTAHKEYLFTWPFATQDDVAEITDYADGLYGDELIYFLDPFAVRANVLPQYWATPRLATEDAPPFVRDYVPSLVDTVANSFSFPTKSAVYNFTVTSIFSSLYVPLPPDHTFHFGAFGTSTSTAKVTVTPDGGSAATVTLLSPTSGNRTNYSVSGVTGVTISFAGVGLLTLAGMIAQVRPNGETVPTGRFISGKGHSGCRFDEFPSVQGYSTPSALDYQSVSVTLTETGAWE